MDDEELSTRLYLSFSLIIFLFLLGSLLFVALIMLFIMMSPVGREFGSFGTVTIITLVIIYAISAFFSSILAYITGRKVMKPLVELSQKSTQVAKGNFNVSVDEESSIPELQNALHSFNLMVHELSKVETLSNDFVSNVSHEFKTPLSVIRSYVNILENTDLTPEERNKYLIIIDESIEKLSTLISNVLKICKLDNQDVVIEKKDYRLDEQIRQCILELAEKFDKKDITLDIDLDCCNIHSDEALLSQVWYNLLSNAIKFSNQNGTISISLRCGDTIRVIIKDDGVGMDEETKKHIFERFFQGDTSHTKEGNGLGLTIVGKILKLCKASINVESELNKGTSFIIDFPKEEMSTVV